MYSDNNSYEKILNRCLSYEDLDEIDKRPGSVVFDCLAPFCLELAEIYIKLDIFERQTHILTATGSNLDNRCYDYGVSRKSATNALRVAEFKKFKLDENGNPEKDENGNNILIKTTIPINTRFATSKSGTDLTYMYIGEIDNQSIIRCEQVGTEGNLYFGTILPLTPVVGLVSASIIDTYEPGEDEEQDEELRIRTLAVINNNAFGGNKADYINKIKLIPGVGNLKIFPAWNGGGTVLISIVDDSYDPITESFIDNIQQQIDPIDNSGVGNGIAPIGHIVTITTPVKSQLRIKLSVELEKDKTIDNIRDDIIAEIEKYFESVRNNFKQDSELIVYRAKIIDYVYNVPSILNITNVLINDLDEDYIFHDTESIGGQSLPYLQGVDIYE